MLSLKMFFSFVEKYFEMKDNMKNQGASEQELFEAVTDSLRESGIRLVEKPKQRRKSLAMRSPSSSVGEALAC